MKILHTADWHLGRTLYGRKRYQEFEAFLNWLADTIQKNQVDVLLMAGDVFDTTAPSNRAQELYYRFLCRVAASCCRHVVLIAGNHDSPSFLNAPRELLKALHVHVVGNPSEDPADEVLVLRDKQNAPELIVCAVPYLRDRDIRTAEAGESLEDKEQKLMDGIRAHYAAVGACAEQKRAELGDDVRGATASGAHSQADIPILGMGHLFTAGGTTLEGDGVRELYVGSLAHVGAGVFPACFQYVALGHLHVPQKVGGRETIRYSGSPVPMGFGEAGQQKSLCLLSFEHDIDSWWGGPDTPGAAGKRGASALGAAGAQSAAGADHAPPGPTVELIPIPVFQQLERINGDWNEINNRLVELAADGADAWLEVIYEGDELKSDLRESLESAVSGTQLELLRVKNNRIIDRVLRRLEEEDTLEELTVEDVFERCLNQHEVPQEQRPELLRAYRETLTSLYETDEHAE